MSETFTADLESLLLPISEDSPSGAWLRYEPVYGQIQAARKEDDESLPQGVWKSQPRRASWPEVQRLCEEALRTRSKDLQIAAWLMDAWVQLHGFEGLREGLRLIRGLCERFWATAYPTLTEEDTSFRVTPILWADKHLALQIKLLRFTRPEGGEQPAYSYADWEFAQRNDNAPRQADKKKVEEKGVVNQPRFLASAGATPRRVFHAIGAALVDAMDELRSLEQLLKERLGKDYASLGSLKKVIPEMQNVLRQLVSTMVPAPEGAEAPGEEGEAEDGAPSMAAGPIRSRAQAYQRLIEASDYLLRTEPHSPTPYLVKRAVSWGNMSLGDLLAEIVGTPADLKAIYSLLGVRGQAEK